MCILLEEQKIIVLNKANIHSKTEEKEVLAEELSHHELGALYSINNNYNKLSERLVRSKQEARAKKMAIRKLVPLSQIIKYLEKGDLNLAELAEELDLSEKFLQTAIEIYTQTQELQLYPNPQWSC